MSRDALVVGINKYHTFPGLKAPAQDAEGIAQCLHTYGDFRVRRMPEIIQESQPKVGQRTAITTRALESALINLFKPEGKYVPQTALFYFSGHGFQRNAGIREGYLATSDTNPETGHFGLSLFWLRRLLQESPIRQRIVILDCCHSGEILNFLEADPGAQSGTDRLFMAASREFEAAYESLESPLSVFTEAVLKGLDPHEARDGIVSNHSLIGAVSRRLKGELQQPLFESSGSDIILTRAQSNLTLVNSFDGNTTLVDPLSTECPYQGLAAFTEAEGTRFFGREDLTNQLLQRVNTQSFCAVLGASGMGKTSLVRAGLIYQLQQGKRIPNSDRWQIKYVTPADAPLQRLAAAFVDPDLDSVAQAEQLHRAEAFLQTGDGSLNRLAQASLQPVSSNPSTALQTVTHLQPQKPNKLVLIIDQLEELLTPHPSSTHQAQRDIFLQRLTDILQTPSPYLVVVVVVRNSSLEQLSQYPMLVAALQTQALQVTPMSYEQIKATITKPAQQAELEYEQNLLYSILLDVAGAPGELALLQQTLVELWLQRQSHPTTGRPCLTMATYTQLGGIRNLLNQRATRVLEQLDTTEKQVAQRIFLALCELGEGTEDNRRCARVTELINGQFPLELVSRTLNRLASEKLIVINGEMQPQATDPQLGLALPQAAWPGPGQATIFSQKPHKKLRSSQPQRRQSRLLKAYRQRFSKLPNMVQETAPKAPQTSIDVVHESLIRSWGLLRQWLCEKRDVLRHQRKLEAAAYDWQQQGYPRHIDYLLTGKRLSDAESFGHRHTHELSALAENYITCSRQHARCCRLKTQTMRILMPCALISGMVASWGQYQWHQGYSPMSAEDGITQINSNINPAKQHLQSEDAHADEAEATQPLQARLLTPASKGVKLLGSTLRAQLPSPWANASQKSVAVIGATAKGCHALTFNSTELEAVLASVSTDLDSTAIATIVTANTVALPLRGQTPIVFARQTATEATFDLPEHSEDDSTALPTAVPPETIEAILQTLAEQSEQPVVAAIVWIAPDGTVQTLTP